jgi:hypothetical protein
MGISDAIISCFSLNGTGSVAFEVIKGKLVLRRPRIRHEIKALDRRNKT